MTHHVQLLAYDVQRAAIVNPRGDEVSIDLSYNDPNGPIEDAPDDTGLRFGLLAHPDRVGQELFLRAMPVPNFPGMSVASKTLVLGALSSDRVDYDNQATPGYHPRFVWPTAPTGAVAGPAPGGMFFSFADEPVWWPQIAILRWTGSYWLVVTATPGCSLRETQAP